MVKVEEVRRRPRDRRSRIVTAAAELFAQHGYAAVGIDDIADAVEVTGSAIYRHFAGKDALLREVVLTSATEIADALDAARADARGAAPEDGVRDGIAIVLDQSQGLSTTYREARRLVELGLVAEITPIQKRIDRYWRDLIGRLNPDLDRSGVATRMAAMNGLSIGAALGPTVSRPRLDELSSASLVAILRAPQQPSTPIAARASSWQVTTSRRDDILRAALRLFAIRGFAEVSVQDIGEAAGISGPTIYHYYESKAEILVDAFELAGQRIAVSADDALASATSAADALELLVRGYARVAFADIELIQTFELEREALPDDERPRINRRQEMLHDRWTDVLLEVRPDLTDVEARLLVFMVFPLVNVAIYIGERSTERLDDIVHVALAHLTA